MLAYIIAALAFLTTVAGLILVVRLRRSLRRKDAELAESHAGLKLAQANYLELSASHNELCGNYCRLVYAHVESLEAQSRAHERARRALELGETLLQILPQAQAPGQVDALWAAYQRDPDLASRN